MTKNLPIMQEHYGKSVNMARIRLMTIFVHAFCVVQPIVCIICTQSLAK